MPQLPNSVEAEQSLLGTLIVYPDKINISEALLVKLLVSCKTEGSTGFF